MTDAPRLGFGFSPCPNDTFAFWAAAHAQVDRGVELVPELGDIEALNQRALDRDRALPITKLSLPALARCLDRYVALDSGAALGFGCGPLVVSRVAGTAIGELADARLAIPGSNTTAFLLASILLPKPRDVVAMRFDEIMPAVASGACDAGLIIHESRFTFADHGLHEIADLGVLWERETGGPLPLAVIAAQRSLAADVVERVEHTLRESVRFARANPDRPRPWIREHAQEMADDVCTRHIELYVNDFSERLGDVGRRAVEQMLLRGREAGVLPAGPQPFRAVV